LITVNAQVEHAEFGIGKVLAVLGDTATVEFFGEELDVDVCELVLREARNSVSTILTPGQSTTDLAFRRSFEAINVGVVPADLDQFIKLTIKGGMVCDTICGLLRGASKQGAYRIFMGYYGSGKSHHLRLVNAIALREGWVTASLELDPKAADPAKPPSVYRELISNLTFPPRADGTRSEDFFDFVKEIRDNWNTIRSLRYFRSSPWFSKGIEALQYLPHRRDDQDYVSAVSWLAGEVKQISAIRSISRRFGYRELVPAMPQTKDTGLLYAFHLVVIHEVLRALGYRGLILIIDEAEHVRTYSANRYLRANNFFDILARCVHSPQKNLCVPYCDYDVSALPPFWREGPHFGLFVGLTDGSDTQDLRRGAGEMKVLIRSPDDAEILKPPSAQDYETWCAAFLAEAALHLGPKVGLLSDVRLRGRIAGALRAHFEQTPDSEKLLRNWTKMAGFPAAVLMSQSTPIAGSELVTMVEDAARQVAGEVLPWDE
jgi:hypothetical protein